MDKRLFKRLVESMIPMEAIVCSERSFSLDCESNQWFSLEPAPVILTSCARRDRRLRAGYLNVSKLRILVPMKTVFFETKTFTATVGEYLTDDEYRRLQKEMQANPETGDVMPRTGGFRKLRWQDARRGKGKRGGLRIIYYWLLNDSQFWMFAIYDKDEAVDLTADQEKALKAAIDAELKRRGGK